MSRRAAKVTLSPAQRRILERFSRTRTLNASLVERSRVLLQASEGRETLSIAQTLGVDRQRVRRWSEFGRPQSHWTRALLVQETIQQGIVESVSVAEVGRWLKKGAFSRTASGTG